MPTILGACREFVIYCSVAVSPLVHALWDCMVATTSAAARHERAVDEDGVVGRDGERGSVGPPPPG